MMPSMFFSGPGPDRAEHLVEATDRALDPRSDRVDVLSHALGHRSVVERIAAARTLGARVRVTLEGENLAEEVGFDIWEPGGDGEQLRQAVCALWRSGVNVCVDHRPTLVHANLICSSSARTVFLTSANLTTSGLTRDHNDGVLITDDVLYEQVRDRLDALWRSGRATPVDAPPLIGADASTEIRLGPGGRIEDHLCQIVESAHRSIRFAVFTVSTAAERILAALAAAATRGVDVAGVVDADQAGQRFDAVPMLRSAGVDARYVPGVLTGGLGRMHHKLLVIDDSDVVTGTYNLSAAARKNYEVTLTLHGPPGRDAAAAAAPRIAALLAGARATMVPLGPGTPR